MPYKSCGARNRHHHHHPHLEACQHIVPPVLVFMLVRNDTMRQCFAMKTQSRGLGAFGGNIVRYVTRRVHAKLVHIHRQTDDKPVWLDSPDVSRGTKRHV